MVPVLLTMAVDENINDVDKKCKSYKDTYNISHTKINIKTMTDKVFKPINLNK